MTINWRNVGLFAAVGVLFLLEGTVRWTIGPTGTEFTIFGDSWNSSLVIMNLCLISAVMSLGVNMQWGYAGLFNTGIVGFVALGALAPVLISSPVVPAVWVGGGVYRLIAGLIFGAGVIAAAVALYRRTEGRRRTLAMLALLLAGFFLYRAILDPAVSFIEANDPALHGNMGGLGLPALISWPVGALFAAAAAWVIGKTALGLRSDYLAIATLGIGEIIVAILKNEDWLDRGVKNVIDIPRPWPVPDEVDLQASARFLDWVHSFGWNPVTASTIMVKLLYGGLFLTVLLILLWACEMALKSPWGRMMRAIRDNETAARAMGKDVTGRHLQVFILGSAICGLAGAMLITLDGQLTPGSFTPLRYTFTIWLMVIVGGSGNNWGAILGSFLIWFLWIKVDPWGNALMFTLTRGMDDASTLKHYLLDSAAQMRTITMGVILLVVLRFAPRGLIPER
ncbi:MAG: branched-chain amino acid ABC transporter permease [Proteobacteria bacterium]|nr:branched-chain amino acid ABC transporter permease [Pseudomonadota bacterium]MBS0574064.1 branched-chain amino acid ABC transporter permease [Pseudomonadota bacterium]